MGVGLVQILHKEKKCGVATTRTPLNRCLIFITNIANLIAVVANVLMYMDYVVSRMEKTFYY